MKSEPAPVKPPKSDQASDLVGSLAKGLTVLDILADHPAGLTLTQTAELAGLTRAGARRLLLTLAASGHVEQQGRIFRLTPRLLTMTRRWLNGASLWSFARAPMQRVAGALGESCSAAVLSGTDVVYVVRVAGPSILSVALHVGTRLPAYCTSMGRVLLAGLPERESDAILMSTERVARTDRTATDLEDLRRIVRRTAREGHAIVDGELEPGLRSIAVPVRDGDGRVMAALNVSTHAARREVAAMHDEVLPLLRKAATSIEDFLALQ